MSEISDFTRYLLDTFKDEPGKCELYFYRFKKDTSWMPKKEKEIGNMDRLELERNGLLYILLEDLEKSRENPAVSGKIQHFINCLCKICLKCGKPSDKFLKWLGNKNGNDENDKIYDQKIKKINDRLMIKLNLKSLKKALHDAKVLDDARYPKTPITLEGTLDDDRYPKTPITLEGTLVEGGKKSRKTKKRKQRKNKTRRSKK